MIFADRYDTNTITSQPQNHMFLEMRDVLGIPKSIDILDHIYSLSPAAKQEEAMESIRAIERRNMAQYVPEHLTVFALCVCTNDL